MYINGKVFDGPIPVPDVKKIDGKWGHMEGTSDCLIQFRHMINRHGYTDYLEIGSLHGVLISRLAEEFPVKSFTAIDPFIGSTAASFIANNHLFSNVHLYTDSSYDILPKLKADGKTYGFIFIDGDHSYDAVLNDAQQSW